MGGVLDDHDFVFFGEGDRALEELGRCGAAGGAVRVAEDEDFRFGADVGGDAFEIGQKIVLGGEREFVDDAAVERGVRAEDRVARHGHERDVAGIDEDGRQHREGVFGADAGDDFGRRIERDVVLALHEAGGRLAEGGDAVVGVAAVLGLVDFLGHAAADDLGGHFVVFADAEIEELAVGKIGERFALGALDLFELVDRGAFAVVCAADAFGEEFLEVGVAHGGYGRRTALGRQGKAEHFKTGGT